MTDFFSTARPGTEVTQGSVTFELPILYFRDDMFGLIHTADLGAVRAVMPSDRLQPVVVPGGRALVGIMAFNYIDTSIGPYGEVAVVVPAVLGERPPPPLVPLLLESKYPGFGSVVLHLPVTKIAARDAGRGQWGYTKFVADMSFNNTPERLECRLSEGDSHILTLRVSKRGLVTRDDKPMVTYSVRKGELVRTSIPQRGVVRNALVPRGCSLELGGHEVAESIRTLGISERPFMSRSYLQRSGILPAGDIVERNVRPLDGYHGTDRVGLHEVSYW